MLMITLFFILITLLMVYLIPCVIKKPLCFIPQITASQFQKKVAYTAHQKKLHHQNNLKVPFLVWMSDSYLAEPENKQLFDNLKRNQDNNRTFYHHNILTRY